MIFCFYRFIEASSNLSISQFFLSLAVDDEKSREHIIALEDSLTTLEIPIDELSSATSVLAAVLVLRNPDLDSTASSTHVPPSLQRYLSHNPELSDDVGNSGGHWLLRAASIVQPAPPTRKNRRVSISLVNAVVDDKSSVEEFQDEGASLEACASLLEVDGRVCESYFMIN